MSVWHRYWRDFGVWHGLFQAFMVTVWVASGVGLLGGLVWMAR
jgi:hypothetical protein